MAEEVKYTISLKDLFSKSIGDANAGVDKFENKLDHAQKKADGLGGGLGKIGGAIAGVFAVEKIAEFAGSVIETTSEFQKFNAVLTNTFGSARAAEEGMALIQDIASKTPFSVAELTDSFVKLSNRGIIPTREEIVSLGDLASSVGKPFDQLTEAALDAMSGENERLKEFGIKAAKQGNKTAYTFKGQTKVIENTEDAVKSYLVSLGQAQGVAGSMNAISETLGGKISNLGDNFDKLKLAVGASSGGLMDFALNGLNKAIEIGTKFFDFLSENSTAIGNAFAPLQKAFQPIIEAFKNLYTKMGLMGGTGSVLQKVFNAIGNTLEFLSPILTGLGMAIGAFVDSISAIGEGFKDFYERFKKPIDGLLTMFRDVFGKIVDIAKNTIGAVGNIIGGILSGDMSQIKAGIGALGEGVKEYVPSAASPRSPPRPRSARSTKARSPRSWTSARWSTCCPARTACCISARSPTSGSRRSPTTCRKARSSRSRCWRPTRRAASSCR